MSMEMVAWQSMYQAGRDHQDQRSISTATLRRIAAFARPHRRRLIAFLVVSVVGAVLVTVFTMAIIVSLIGAVASLFRGGRYVHGEVEAAAAAPVTGARGSSTARESSAVGSATPPGRWPRRPSR